MANLFLPRPTWGIRIDPIPVFRPWVSLAKPQRCLHIAFCIRKCIPTIDRNRRQFAGVALGTGHTVEPQVRIWENGEFVVFGGLGVYGMYAGSNGVLSLFSSVFSVDSNEQPHPPKRSQVHQWVLSPNDVFPSPFHFLLLVWTRLWNLGETSGR